MIFEHAVPESVGLDSRHILNFLDELERKHVPMHSFLLFSGESILAEGYYAPYTRDSLHRMFSISKSFTAIAVGILAGDGLLDLSDPVIRYFPDKVPQNVHPWIAEMTIENLLMMRTCHASTTYKSGASDWVGSFFTTPPTHRAGTIFHYDTSAAHVLAALVERLSGMPLLDFLRERLRPLALSQESYMLTDPEGVSMGGTGLVATTADLLKFGYLLLKNGTIDGKQLVPAEFLTRATSCLTENAVTAPLPSEGCGYGYMIWKNERGGYVCYGMGGQLLMVFPEKQTIFVTTADTQGIAGGNQLIYDAFYRHLYDKIQVLQSSRTGSFDSDSGDADIRCSIPQYSSPGQSASSGDSDCHDNAAQQTLIQRLASLAIAPLSPYADGRSWVQDASRWRRYDGSSYRIVDTSCRFSISKSEIVSGFTYFSFIFTNSQKGLIQFTLNQRDYTLSFGFGKMESGMFPVYDLTYAASGAWLDEHTLYVRFHIIDRYVGSVHMQFYFGENDVTIFMKKVEESCFAEFNGHFYGIKDKK